MMTLHQTYMPGSGYVYSSIFKSFNNKSVTGMSDEQQDVVLIGKKPIKNYVIACLTLFNAGKQTIKIKARGRVIYQAVETVELLRRAFIKDLKVQEISIGSQEFKKANGFKNTVSTINIVISKPIKQRS